MNRIRVKNISTAKKLLYVILLYEKNIHVTWDQCDVYESAYVEQDYFFYFDTEIDAITFKLECL